MNQKGYVIQIVLIVFSIIIGLMIFPIKFPKPVEGGPCAVGDPPDKEEVLRGLPGVRESAPGFDPETALQIGGPDVDNPADFVLIRKNVPLPEGSELEGYEFLGKDLFNYLTHTGKANDEVVQKPGYSSYYPTWGALTVNDQNIEFKTEGLIFLVNNDPASQITLGDKKIKVADVYQQQRAFDNPQKKYKTEDLFKCSSSTTIPGSVMVPAQNVSLTHKQLQLEWIRFQKIGFWKAHCKPAVYLYPERKQLVNVKVSPKGELSYTDPVYDPDKGWTVWAEPNGDLLSALSNQPSARKYDYLYYESKLLDSEIKKPTKGWVVRYESRVKNQESSEMKKLFDQILPELGLNEKEKKDFMNYWLNKLPDSPYYYVGLVEKKQRDYLEALEVTPNPDTSIRFSLYFEMLDQPKAVEEPTINTPKRNGFTLVDWGGMIKLHPGTPFTCSQ